MDRAYENKEGIRTMGTRKRIHTIRKKEISDTHHEERVPRVFNTHKK